MLKHARSLCLAQENVILDFLMFGLLTKVTFKNSYNLYKTIAVDGKCPLT